MKIENLSLQSGPSHSGVAPIEYGPMEPQEQEAVFDLYRRVLPAPNRVITLHRWEAGRTAPVSARHVFVARDGTQVVGAMTTVPVTLCGRGSTLCGAWQQESVVSPEYRRRGVASGLIEKAGEGFDLLMAKGTSPAMAKVRRAAGFVDVPSSTYLVCVLRPWGNILPALHPLGWLISCLRSWQSAGPVGMVRVVEQFDERFDVLAEERSARSALCVRRDAALLRERYLETPGGAYRILTVEDRTRVRGAAVLRPPQREGDPAWLVDWIRGRSDPESEHLLIGAALREARAFGAGLLAAFASDPEARRVLRGWGFLETYRSPRFLVRWQNERAHRLVACIPLDMWHGDGDVEMYEDLEAE